MTFTRRRRRGLGRPLDVVLDDTRAVVALAACTERPLHVLGLTKAASRNSKKRGGGGSIFDREWKRIG